MDFMFIGVVAFFNFAVIIAKLNHARYADAVLDVVSLMLLNAMFAGSFGGAVIATVASAVMSLYLFFTPLKFLEWNKESNETAEPESYPDLTKETDLDAILAKYNL